MKKSYTEAEAKNILTEKGLTQIDLSLYFNTSDGVNFEEKKDFEELFQMRTFVKERIKKQSNEVLGKTYRGNTSRGKGKTGTIQRCMGYKRSK